MDEKTISLDTIGRCDLIFKNRYSTERMITRFDNSILPGEIKAMPPEKLLAQFEALILKVANRYKKTAEKTKRFESSDVEQIAAIALLKARESYDPTKQASFLTHAFNVMNWEIMRALRIYDPAGGYRKEPIILSLDEPINEDGDITRGDTIQSDGEPLDDMAERIDTAARVRAAVRTLPAIQEEIINRLYLNEPTETRPEIAKDKGISAAAIGRQKEKAFYILRNKLRNLQPDLPKHIGLNRFNTNWTSEPEQFVLIREKRFEQWLRDYEEFIENY